MVQAFTNQLHRLNHNFNFVVNARNSLEGLEQGNYTTHVMDAHQTFKGNRKKANKLLRLKSSRSLRQKETRNKNAEMLLARGVSGLQVAKPSRLRTTQWKIILLKMKSLVVMQLVSRLGIICHLMTNLNDLLNSIEDELY